MFRKSKLELVLSFIVVMTLIGCLFFVEMPANNVEVVATLSTNLNQPK